MIIFHDKDTYFNIYDVIDNYLRYILSRDFKYPFIQPVDKVWVEDTYVHLNDKNVSSREHTFLSRHLAPASEVAGSGGHTLPF
jgi:hypothetical protein